MASNASKLTVKVIEGAEPGCKDIILWDVDVKGFGLKVTPKGKKTFLFSYRTGDHVQRKPRIGDFPAMKPEAARAIALQWKAEVAAGGDPSAERRAKRTLRGKGTLSDIFEDYRKAKANLRSIKEIERIFKKDILPTLGNRRVEDVSRADISRLLDKLGARSRAVAANARRQLSAFYSWAMPRLPDGTVNPVAGAAAAPAVPARERVLTDKELGMLWVILERESEPWRTALRLLILTGQRRGEVFDANWDEFDLKQSSWKIPASRAKNGKAHIVPLTPDVVALLEKLVSPKSGPLFPNSATGTRAFSRAATRIQQALDEALGNTVPKWTWHDIRRTMATGLQRLGIRLEVTEAVLNHVSGSRAGIVGVYQRHDWAEEKRDALEKWAKEVKRIADSQLLNTDP